MCHKQKSVNGIKDILIKELISSTISVSMGTTDLLLIMNDGYKFTLVITDYLSHYTKIIPTEKMCSICN